VNTKDANKCLQKVATDEPIFVLRAQDILAPEVVRAWARQAKEHGTPAVKVHEALALADAMERWPTRKYPD
jgi:ribosomal protein L7Ae-like RNA K-turn-binding protein